MVLIYPDKISSIETIKRVLFMYFKGCKINLKKNINVVKTILTLSV